MGATQLMLEHFRWCHEMLYPCLLPGRLDAIGCRIAVRASVWVAIRTKGERFFILDSAGPESVQTAAPSGVQSLFGLSYEQLSSIVAQSDEREIPRPPACPGPLPRLDCPTSTPSPLSRPRSEKSCGGRLRCRPSAHSSDFSLRRRDRTLSDRHERQPDCRDRLDAGRRRRRRQRDDAVARLHASRATICVSSQIGCAVNCQFCLTAKLGIERNLTAGEIAGQVVAVLQPASGRAWP